jgi:hypothetical protein
MWTQGVHASCANNHKSFELSCPLIFNDAIGKMLKMVWKKNYHFLKQCHKLGLSIIILNRENGCNAQMDSVISHISYLLIPATYWEKATTSANPGENHSVMSWNFMKYFMKPFFSWKNIPSKFHAISWKVLWNISWNLIKYLYYFVL